MQPSTLCTNFTPILLKTNNHALKKKVCNRYKSYLEINQYQSPKCTSFSSIQTLRQSAPSASKSPRLLTSLSQFPKILKLNYNSSSLPDSRTGTSRSTRDLSKHLESSSSVISKGSRLKLRLNRMMKSLLIWKFF